VGNSGPENKTSAFIADSNGTIFGISGNGRGMLYDSKLDIARFSGRALLDISLGDVNKDGQYDRLIACGRSGEIDLYQFSDQNADSLIDTVSTSSWEEQFTTPPVVFDSYFFIGTESGKILRFLLQNGGLDSTFIFSDKIISFSVKSPKEVVIAQNADTQTDLSPAVIDLNSDGIYETIYIPTLDKLQIVDENQTKTIQLEMPIVSQPAFADFDNDGRYEILFNTAQNIEAKNFNGSNVSNFPITPIMQAEELLTGTPLILDINGDSNSDVVVVSSLGQVFAFDRNGQIVDGFPTTIGGTVSKTSVAEDFDMDNHIELLSMNDKGEIFSWQLYVSRPESNLLWNQHNPDPTHNMYIPEMLNPIPTESTSLMPENSVYNYPNPNTQNYTTIRYFLNEDANVDIKIFDLAGDLVDNLSGPGQGNIHNELRWDLSDISSGVYLCRIEANSVNEKSVKIIKIMVVK
jgi:hypothetical protein